MIIPKYLTCLATKSWRTKETMKSIALSFVAKAISIICNLLIVPMTIHYVNPTQYGIWLTLSSIIGWIGFFDLGIGNGFRNKYAESIAKGDTELAKQYVATSYFVIGGLMVVLLLVLWVCNVLTNWSELLNVDSSYFDELRKVFFVLSFFFCLNMVVRLYSTLLTADQKPGIAAIIEAIGQILSLTAIFILIKFTQGSLLNLALFYSSIPTLFLLICSAFSFGFTRYKFFSPKYRNVRFSLIRNILGLGLQFFVIYLCIIFIFQISNIVLSRELGPDSVTEYNIAYKYFNVLQSSFMIIITPFWTAFTDAYTKNDERWMYKAKNSLEKAWGISVFVALIMLVLSEYFYAVWIGKSIRVTFSLSMLMAIYVIIMNISALYMNLVNGIGTMRIQLIIYMIFAILSYPSMVYFVRNLGIVGICVFPTLAYLFQAVFAKVQIEKILNGTAVGIWKK